MSDVTIPREKFLTLLGLAAEAIYIQASEYSNYPDENDVLIMEEMHKVANLSMDETLKFAIGLSRARGSV